MILLLLHLHHRIQLFVYTEYKKKISKSKHSYQQCCVTSPMYAPISMAMASAPESPFACAFVVSFFLKKEKQI